MKAVAVDRETLDKHAARQLGLFTRAQAKECGFTVSQIARRFREGDWVELRRGVLAERGRAVTPKIRDMAVLLSVPGAILAGPSALRWHGVDLPDTGTCIALGPARKVRPRGVAIFREVVPDEEVVLIGHAAVTEFERAIFDSARILPDVSAHALLEQSVERGWTTLARLADRISAFTNRRGAPRLVRLLQQASRSSRGNSVSLARRLLEKAGIWGWTTNAPIADRWGLVCVGDLVFERPRVLIQLDGTADEFGGERAERLRRRHNRLLVAGWTVLTFGWHDLGSRPDDVIRAVRVALDRAKR
jgi:Transcriptional regulator, AbiEi antitoxin